MLSEAHRQPSQLKIDAAIAFVALVTGTALLDILWGIH